MIKQEELSVISELHEFNREASGVAFALVMRDNKGGLTVHPREEQPCYGEMRKYAETHTDATRDEEKPDDLHDPFPSGTPEAVAFPFYGRHYGYVFNDEFIEMIFSDRSPWIRGFGSSEDVEFTRDGTTIIGVVLKNTEVDPTVLVNLMNTLRSCQPKWFIDPVVKEMIGDDRLRLLFSVVRSNDNLSGGSPGYYSPVHWDFERFLGQNPVDYSGGSFRDGYDYNRRDLHRIFEDSDGVSEEEDDWGDVSYELAEGKKSFPLIWSEVYNTFPQHPTYSFLRKPPEEPELTRVMVKAFIDHIDSQLGAERKAA